MEKGTDRVKRGLAEMLKGGVIMDVVNAEQAKIAEEAGAVSVMALERVPADIRKEGGVARMSDPELIAEIQEAVSIPVMAKCRIGHFAEAAVLSAHVPTDAVSAARSAKVWCLRALVASKMGNASAAKSAYLRAVEADGLGVAVRRVGLVIAPLLQEAQLLSADIADPVARAAMETPSAAHELDLPHLAWFVSVGNSEIAEDFLGFACGRVGGVQGRAVLAEAYAHLVAHALRDFDYDKARRCAILQRGLEGESNQIPFEEEQAPADYIGWELTVDQVQKTLA